MLMTSCMAGSPFDQDADGSHVVGKVVDTSDNPIEHIKVTLKWGGNSEKIELYTSSEGVFHSEALIETDGPTTLEIKLEDIDGEENGGLFETMEDSVMLYPEETGEGGTDESIRFDLVYRLNRATASESNPQS